MYDSSRNLDIPVAGALTLILETAVPAAQRTATACDDRRDML